MTDQTIKADAGKAQLSLVPTQIIYDIARVREFGVEKYKDPDNWKEVSKERYRDAAFRHWLAYLADPQGVDDESGLSHLAHCACNIAFLCEMERKDGEGLHRTDRNSRRHKSWSGKNRVLSGSRHRTLPRWVCALPCVVVGWLLRGLHERV